MFIWRHYNGITARSLYLNSEATVFNAGSVQTGCPLLPVNLPSLVYPHPFSKILNVYKAHSKPKISAATETQ